jgi:dienelactone hydrolase
MFGSFQQAGRGMQFTQRTIRPALNSAMLAVTCGLLAAGLPAVKQIVAADEHGALSTQLTALDARVIPADERPAAAGMLERQLDSRIEAANQASSRAWHALDSREAWQTFRAARLAALRESLGRWPQPATQAGALQLHVTGTIRGEGFTVDNLLFETRPGLWSSANLYRPLEANKPGLGILLAHSHHNPKTERELQTMGMTWARLGALVLVPDHLGHGERRQHPFRSDNDYPLPFKRSRQDYYCRYDTSLELYLLGDSLMGWMCWDLMRGLDVLLAQPGVDPDRTFILGAVAGGGDPAAVTAALDERFAATGAFNFGGPQPENGFPLPDDSETTFPYAGGGSWESTRNLRLSAAGGFLPWVIVGSIAPRRLVYGHEFSWDRPHDPVWQRLEKIYAWEHAPDALAFAHGAGTLSGQPPQATHCNNVGAPHRRLIYPALSRWFDMPGGTELEHSQPIETEKLHCWTDQYAARLRPKLMHQIAGERAVQEIAAARIELAPMPAQRRRLELRRRWNAALGEDRAHHAAKVVSSAHDPQSLPRHDVERLLLETEPGIRVPLVLLLPKGDKPWPVVVGVAQQGKQALLAQRSDFVAALLSREIAVCLVDPRGVGETRSADARRERDCADTSLSASEMMLGGTLLGARLQDLLSVVAHLRTRPDIDSRRIAVWGDSLQPFNAADEQLLVPHGIGQRPRAAEPLGGLLAQLAALAQDDLRAVYVRRGLGSFASVFDSPMVYLPHDAIVPGAVPLGDLPLLVENLTPMPVRMTELVDAGNRPLPQQQLDDLLAEARAAYSAAGNPGALELSASDDAEKAAAWLAKQLAAD